MSIQTLKEEVQKLDKTEQAELMHFMVELLATEETEISKEWEEEIEKREEALKNGTSVGKPAREVLAKYLNNG